MNTITTELWPGAKHVCDPADLTGGIDADMAAKGKCGRIIVFFARKQGLIPSEMEGYFTCAGSLRNGSPLNLKHDDHLPECGTCLSSMCENLINRHPPLSKELKEHTTGGAGGQTLPS